MGMCHPLYPVAQRLVGRPVNVYHMDGMIYGGMLQSAAPHGIYVMNPVRRARLMTATDKAVNAELAVRATANQIDIETVYSPGAFFAFGALTGLTLGALASPFWW